MNRVALTLYEGEATPNDVYMRVCSLPVADPVSEQATDVWMWQPTGGVEMQLDDVVEGSVTVRHLLRYLLALAAGKASGGGTASIAYRDQADSKDRIILTVDASGNRSAVVVNGT